jgi:hypothetical protein
MIHEIVVKPKLASKNGGLHDYKRGRNKGRHGQNHRSHQSECMAV